MQAAMANVHSSRWPANVGMAWITVALALALHVMDEATHDFLALYNQNAAAIRGRVPWLPIPIFSFRVWLALLVTAVVLLLILSPFAYRHQGTGTRWIRPLAWVLAVIMLLNGLNHLAGSFYLGRLAPGVESSPVLLLTSAYLIFSLRKTRSQPTTAPRLTSAL